MEGGIKSQFSSIRFGLHVYIVCSKSMMYVWFRVEINADLSPLLRKGLCSHPTILFSSYQSRIWHGATQKQEGGWDDLSVALMFYNSIKNSKKGRVYNRSMAGVHVPKEAVLPGLPTMQQRPHLIIPTCGTPQAGNFSGNLSQNRWTGGPGLSEVCSKHPSTEYRWLGIK